MRKRVRDKEKEKEERKEEEKEIEKETKKRDERKEKEKRKRKEGKRDEEMERKERTREKRKEQGEKKKVKRKDRRKRKKEKEVGDRTVPYSRSQTSNKLFNDTSNGASVRDYSFHTLGNHIENIIALSSPLPVAHVGTIACHTSDDLHFLASLDECLSR